MRVNIATQRPQFVPVQQIIRNRQTERNPVVRLSVRTHARVDHVETAIQARNARIFDPERGEAGWVWRGPEDRFRVAVEREQIGGEDGQADEAATEIRAGVILRTGTVMDRDHAIGQARVRGRDHREERAQDCVVLVRLGEKDRRGIESNACLPPVGCRRQNGFALVQTVCCKFAHSQNSSWLYGWVSRIRAIQDPRSAL